MERLKIVLVVVDNTGVRATGRYRDRLCQSAETETFPEARACVWANSTTPRLDHIKRHIEQERQNHLWIGYFLLPDSEDILQIARSKALQAHGGG